MILALDRLPDGTTLRGVTAATASAGGRPATRVELEPRLRTGTLGTDFGDKPTFVMLPLPFLDGVLEVDVLARLAPDAPDYARGFIGLAYRIQDGGDRFESVYLRPTNGRALAPPPPRNVRAVQYFAYPEWPFDRLRAEAPDGGFEAGADIAPDRWARLRLEVDGRSMVVQVDGIPVLALAATRAAPASGSVGLWVDIGTEGYFADLRATPSR